MAKKLDGAIEKRRVVIDGKPYDRFIGYDVAKKGFEDQDARVVMDRDPETGVIHVRSVEFF